MIRGLPTSVLFPSVTRARELFAARDVLRDDRKQIDRFLRAAKRRGAAAGYIARHQKAW